MSQTYSLLAILLRPAVVFALRRGLKVRDILEVLKHVFLEEAKAALDEKQESVSISRLAVMTGMQRRDVVRVEEQGQDPSRQLNIVTKVIGQWCHDKRYSRKGRAKPLRYEGVNSDFAELIATVSVDLSHYAVLFELERLGMVERKGDELILRDTLYSVSADSDDGYALLGNDMRDFIAGVDSNLGGKPVVPNLHITTRYDNIVLKALPEIRKWILKRGAEFHSDVRSYLSSFDKDLNRGLAKEAGGGRVTVGSFSLTEDALGESKHQDAV